MPKPDAESESFIDSIIPTSFFDLIKQERFFLILIGLFIFLAGFSYPYPHIAMWVGFALAGYSAIANDSIQTIGTFIASNEDKKWWVLWLYIGFIFVGTVSYSWYFFDGDVSHGRLLSKGFSQQPETFTFLQIGAPIFLLILTRLRMPVSTTFLLLSCFSTSAGAIGSVLTKSVSGYFVAFIAAIIIWFIFAGIFTKYFNGKPHPGWSVAQWITSGTLWSVWIMQDAANIAVYLPRSLSAGQFAAFALYIFFGLGILFYLRGDKIQSVVREKANVTDIRAATVIDFVYAVILYYFKIKSQIPMSTTWVFIGLLAGREIAITFSRYYKKQTSPRKAFRMIGRDFGFAMIGLIVSIILAISINPELFNEVASYF